MKQDIQLVLTCLMALMATGQAESRSSMDLFFDFALNRIVSPAMIANGKDSFKLDKAEISFNVPTLATVDWKVTGLTIEKFSTSTRVGSSFVGSINSPDNVTFVAPVSFGSITVRMDKIEGSVGKMVTNGGPANLTVGSNQVTLSVSMLTSSESGCKTAVNWARINNFDEASVTMPTGFYNKMAQKLLNPLLKHEKSRATILENINPWFNDAMVKLGSDYIDLCSAPILGLSE